MSSVDKIRILFLAANPKYTVTLQLGKEYRKIREAIQMSEHRDHFDLRHEPSVLAEELDDLLLEYKPQIVHFSGHGSEEGALQFEDENAQAQEASPKVLKNLFKILKENIVCVLLNACYSEMQAEAIKEHIPCVIGMSTAISDRAAIKFAKAFYVALGYGKSVNDAFELGKSELERSNIPEEQTPILKYALGVDPSKVFLINEGSYGGRTSSQQGTAGFVISASIDDTPLQTQKDYLEEKMEYMLRAIEHSNKGDYRDAIKYYNKILEIDPKHKNALYRKGKALFNLGKYDEAIKEYDKALQIDKDDNYALNNKGVALLRLGKYDEAIKEYDKALQIDKDDNYALYNKGFALLRMSKYEEAIGLYDKVESTSSVYKLALNEKGDALSRLGKYDEALSTFDKILEIDEAYGPALYNKGVVLSELGKPDEAIKYYNKVPPTDPNYAYALNNKGNILANKGMYDQAIRAFDEALGINPNYTDALYNKALNLERKGEYDDAIMYYKRVLHVEPNASDAANNIGFILYRQDEYSKSLEWFDKALKLDPNNKHAQGNKQLALGKLG